MDDHLPTIGGKFVDQVPTYLGREAVARGRSVWNHGFSLMQMARYIRREDTLVCLLPAGRVLGSISTEGGEHIWETVLLDMID